MRVQIYGRFGQYHPTFNPKKNHDDRRKNQPFLARVDPKIQNLNQSRIEATKAAIAGE